MRNIERILLFIETGGPGGAERVVAALAKGFKDLGKKVDVCTLRTGWLTEELAAIGVPHHLIESTRGFDVFLPLKIARLAKSLKVDVLHTHLLDSNFYGAIAARIAGIPHLATEHGDVHHTQKKRFLSLKLGCLNLLQTKISAVSEFTAKRLAELGINKSNISCIGNPMELATPLPGIRAKIRSELGVAPDRQNHWLWLHVANFRPVKDQATLIKGFAAACKNSPIPQSLALVGDGELKPELQHLASSLGVQNLVHFVGFQNNVPHWLCAADGFILSSRSEALPMSVLEAGMSGLVLVSSAVGGVPEIITPATGYLFKAGDSEELGEVLSKVVTNIPRSLQLAQAAREQIIAKYSTEKILEELLSVYSGI